MIENYHICTYSLTTKLQAGKKNNEKKPCLHHLQFSDLEVKKRIRNNEPGSLLT